ncbi:MAG: adenylate/guanylate cyclase domain-containing protein [Proteobacteria bacterium]|nr:adenylate/guanylate cyclase domain-containing protein [Pseudomonadota bacterium]
MAVSRADIGGVSADGDVDGIWTRLGKRFVRRRESVVHHSLWWHIAHWFGHGRWIGIIVLLALGVLRGVDPLPVEALRNRTFDVYQQIQPRAFPDPMLTVIVDLDEESLAELGQWPWPRTLVAQMLENLMKMDAAVVGFDILFSEKDRMSPAEFAASSPQLDEETRAKLSKLTSNDVVFARVLKKSRAVLGQSGYHEVVIGATTRKLKKAPFARKGPDPRPFIPTLQSMIRPVEDLEKATQGLGMITVSPDSDGVVRRVPMMVAVNKSVFPALSLEMLRVGLGNRPFFAVSNQDGVQEVILTKQFRIPTDKNGNTWVYFTAVDPEKRYVSAKDVVSGKIDKERIAGKLVLIGTSATGLKDIRNTPIDPALPGVEVHANILETIVSKTYLRRPADSLGKELSIALVAGLLMIVFVPLIGAGLTLGLVVVIVGGVTGYSWLQFANNHTLFDATYPGLSTLLLYSLLTYTSYAETAKERKQVKGAFGQYLSPALLEQLADDPARLQLGGEMKEMTIMFSDIRGFTTISEQFKTDPQGLTKLINRFLTPMTDMIMQRKGTIDKYMGDCIMAFWNAPMEDEDHARHACESALAMFDALEGINDDVRREAEEDGRKYFPLNVGIGVNSGEVVVGNMGSDQRFDYSVLGDAVNLSARLEGQSKNYGVGIVVGEDTVQRVPDDFAFIELDLIAVKGKVEAVRIFTLLGAHEIVSDPDYQTFRAKHEAMIDAYRSQQWADATELANACRTLEKYGLSELYDLYDGRLDEYLTDPPPPDWDGVYVATSK